jgi:hypothetical protein
MIFLFKKPKLVLDFFTYSEPAYHANKIDYAHSFYPQWWKDTPKTYTNDFYEASTIKKCRAVIDSYQYGAIIPMWSDMALDIKNKTYKWQFADFKTEAHAHSAEQWKTYADPKNYAHLKIISPWSVKCKHNIKFQFLSPFWSHPIDSIYRVLPGIVDYKYNYGTHINLLINIQNDYRGMIPAATPMAHIIPLSEKELIIKNHLVSIEEYKNNFWDPYTFTDAYKHAKNNIDKQEKCPFNFLRGK